MYTRIFILMIAMIGLTACSSPQTFQAAGVHNGQTYKLEVRRPDDLFNPTLTLLINNKAALSVKRKNLMADRNCARTAIASWKCEYTSTFEGKSILLVEETNTTLASNSLYYDVYFDGSYVQRVVAALY